MLCSIGPFAENLPVADGFSAQTVGDAESVTILWRDLDELVLSLEVDFNNRSKNIKK